MEAIGLGGEENAGRRLTVLRAIDKLDKFGVEGVRQLLGEGRKDESGDFTPGAGLDEEACRYVIDYLSVGQLDQPDGSAVTSQGSNRGNQTHIDGMHELLQMRMLWQAAGYDKGRIQIDQSVVRGLEYYTGPVFEAELLFDVVNEKGQKVQFGSVGGGGRYDGLVSRFMSQPVPATGFSIGVSRLMTALKNLGRLETSERTGPVVVTVMDKDRMADYQAMATKLRKALNADPSKPPVPVEVFQGNPKQFGKQLQYADRIGSPVVVIQGADEREAGKVQVKDLALGKELSAQITDNAEWREARAGQEMVEEDQLVEAVQAILSRIAGSSSR